MEKDVEERLRNKFTLMDRTDPAAIQAAQQVGLLLLLLLQGVWPNVINIW